MKPHLIALFTVFVWGMTFVSTKVLLGAMSPLWILLIRFTLGFLALCALRPRLLRMEQRSHELLFIGAGTTGIAAYYLLENVALVHATATAVGVIVAAAPLFTAILSALSGDRSALTVRFFVGFVLAMAGLVMVGASAGGMGAFAFDAEGLLGDGLALLAALVWAVYSLLVQRIARLGYETIASTKRTFFWGLLFIVPATFLFGGSAPAAEACLQPSIVANLLFLGLVASAACFVTWGVAVKELGPAISTTYIYLVPAITATASILILGEPLSAPIICGLSLAITGLLLSQKRVNPSNPMSSAAGGKSGQGEG